MSKTKQEGTTGDSPFPLPDEKNLLRLYYEGGRLPSPTGGFLMVLRVRSEDDGSGSILLECSAASLRYLLRVPKATRTERSKVTAMIKEGFEPQCPRHEHQLLVRVRNDFLCPRCGVRFAKA